MNVEPQTGNRKPRLEVRGKLGSKTLYCNFADVNFPLQVTLVDAEYLQDYENLNSLPAQELISKFVTEVTNMLLCCSSLGESSSQRASHLNEKRN